MDRTERGRRYASIIYNLTHVLIKLSEYQEVIEVCTQGRKVCIETDVLALLPDIAVSEATAHLYLKNKEEGIRILLNACHVFELYKKFDDLEMIKAYTMKHYGISLEKMMNPEIVYVT